MTAQETQTMIAHKFNENTTTASLLGHLVQARNLGKYIVICPILKMVTQPLF